MEEDFFNEWTGKKAKISISGGRYYKGLILSVGEDFLKMKDFKSNIVFVKLENINIIEEWKE